MQLIKLKKFRWYHIPSFLFNHLLVIEHAICYQDLPYGSFARQTLDLYAPKQARIDAALIVFVHGGSWQTGQKDDYVFLAQSLAKSGFFVACINYRLAPEHPFPHYVDDTIMACNWLQQSEQALRYGYNAQKMILLGHSAGAFNIMAAIYAAPVVSIQLKRLDWIHAAIGIAGPYSFEHRGDPVAAPAFNQSSAPAEIMPDGFVFHNHIKHLLLLAGKDNLVADSNTWRFQAALQQENNYVQVERISHSSHISCIATLAPILEKFYPTKQWIERIMDAV